MRGLTRFLRFYSSPPSAASRTDQIAARLPKRLRPYASRFAAAPYSHITSFLVLHELTAVVPLAGIFYLIHSTQWTPPGLPGEWVEQGIQKWGSYTRKKGWEIFKGEEGARLVVELATAWAAVKAALPLRIGLSLWATPWFARAFVVPFAALVKR